MLLVHTSDHSVYLFDANSGASKLVVRSSTVSVAVGMWEGTTYIAMLRISGLTKAVKVTVYAYVANNLKHQWDVRIQVDNMDHIDHVTMAFISSPSSVVVCIRGVFVWAGLDPRTGNYDSRTIFVSNRDQQSFNSVAHIPGSVGRALILSGDIGIIVNEIGEPVGDSITVDGLTCPIDTIVVVESRLLIIAGHSLHVIYLEQGAQNQDVLTLPTVQGAAAWRMGGTSFNELLIVPLYSKNLIWLLCPMSQKAQLQRAIEERNPLTAKRLIDSQLDLPSDSTLWVRCGLLLIRDGFVSEGIECMEKFRSEPLDPVNILSLFPNYMNTLIEQKISSSSEDTEWSMNDVWMNSNASETQINGDRQIILEYLFRIRQFPGVLHSDAVDSLIVHLLIDMDSEDAVIAFLSTPNNTSPPVVGPRLESKQWKQCLALLYSTSKDHISQAIELWKQIAENSPVQIREALPFLEKILSDPTKCDGSVLLEHTRCLVALDETMALSILGQRTDLPPSTVLVNLPDDMTRYGYLKRTSSMRDHRDESRYLNTELAHVLIRIVLQQSAKSLVGASGHEWMVSNDMPIKGSNSAAQFVFQVLSRRNSESDGASWRTVLDAHLIQYADDMDLAAVEQCVASKGMYRENAILAAIRGEHDRVLSILVGTLDDVSLGMEYIRRFVPGTDHEQMLNKHVLENNSVQLWDVAGNIIALFESSPLDIVGTIGLMPDDMDMAQGAVALKSIIESMVHRKREKQMIKALGQSTLLSLKKAVKDREREHVNIIDQDTSCDACSLRIGTKICVKTDTSLLCLNCFKN
jgi:hypothetical protein